MIKKFQRRIEEFYCTKCNSRVNGNGYTNHCPKCLWSLHVDVYPGDRAAKCGGLMKPVSVESKAGNYILVHRCVICRHEKRNKTNINDDFDLIIKTASNTGRR